MKDKEPSQGTRDMKNNKNVDFESSLIAADPAKNVKTPKLNDGVFHELDGRKTKRYLNIDAKPRIKLIGIAASALVVILTTSSILNSQNITQGEYIRAFNIVLAAHSQSSPNYGVMWHEGDVAAEYNYHLTGLEALDRNNSGSRYTSFNQT